jgi:CRP/FNR family cyclic AMP-dependent transcriptional regulator
MTKAGANSKKEYQDLPFFQGLTPAHQKRLAEFAHEVRFERDQVVFREGDASTSFYLVLSGRVALEVTAMGRALRVVTLDEGEEFGWSSLMPSQSKQLQARALDAVRALAFDGPKLRQACEDDPVFGYEIMKRLLSVVSERLQAMRVQLFDMYSPSRIR